MKDLQQPGSRLYYISAASGSDSLGRIYFWNGTQIIDAAGSSVDAAGQPYGTDPMNPSAAVKAFRRWSYVGPRGADSDIGTAGVPGSPTAAFRGGFPDWWLFRRGETFDLGADLLSFARESTPTATSVNGSLAVSGGRSATERQIVGAYGDPCQARPRFIHPMLGFVSKYYSSYAPTLKNVAYLSLHFDGHDRPAGGNAVGLELLGQKSDSTDILFEDIWLDAASVSIGMTNAGQFTIRRSLVTDNFVTDGSHVEGLYYDGSRQGSLRIHESILLRNGFSHGDPKTMAWPPTGTQTWDLFNRNMYISGQTNSAVSGVFDSVSMLGASGDQFRPGVRVERNFFYQGYIGFGAHGGYSDTDGATGSILDNVLQRFTGTGTNDNRGQPGWGFILGGGANSVEVTRNIVTGAQSAATSFAIKLQPVFQDCEVPYVYATRANKIYGNIFDSGNASAAINVTDGADSCYGAVLPGVKGNSVTGNVLINSSAKDSEYTPILGAIGTQTDTTIQNNSSFKDRASAAATQGWTDPNRTLKTYLLSQGVTVSSVDGFPEYFQAATQMRRGMWRPELTSTALVNHIRSGFAMAALPAK